MAPKRQREIALAVLVVVLIGIVTWRLGWTTSPSPAPQGSAPSGGVGQAKERRDPLHVDLDALKRERPEPEANERNPFRFNSRTPTSSQLTPPPPVTQMKQPDTGLTSGEPVEPPLPRIGLKFIGLVKSEVDPTIGQVAILRDERGVYYGREGEIIEGRYRILRIGVESVDLAYIDGRGRQTIRFTGQ